MPRLALILRTIFTCLLDFFLLFGIPYLLLTQPQTSSIVSGSGVMGANLLSVLLFFSIFVIALTVVKNFSRQGSLTYLIAGLILIGSGVGFFLLLGSLNSPQPRLGVTTVFANIQGSRVTIAIDYFYLVLIWMGVAALKATSLILGFIEARRSSQHLRLPLPPQRVPNPAVS